MEFSRDYLQEVLPAGLPPLEFVPEDVVAAYASDRYEDALVRRSAYWTYAIFSELRDGLFHVSLNRHDRPFWGDHFWFSEFPGDSHTLSRLLAVGVLDRDFEGSGFGLTFQSPRIKKSRKIGRMKFPRLGQDFPIAALALVDDLHAPPSPVHSTATCWADDNTAPGSWGAVTCRHGMAGLSAGASVPTLSGVTGTLDRKAPASIDAAFMVGVGSPSSPSTLSVVTYPAAGLKVDVATLSGAQSRSVTSTMNTLGIIDDPVFPIRVFIDHPCSPGDSGSLVTDVGARGIGIYSGATVSHPGTSKAQTLGFAQHLEQAALILDVTLYT